MSHNKHHTNMTLVSERGCDVNMMNLNGALSDEHVFEEHGNKDRI